MTPEDVVRDGLDAYWEAPSEYHSALDALVAERDRIAAERDEALASVVLYVNERDAARDGWEAQVRSEEREMRRRIEAEARADNLAPYVMRSQAAQARVAALTEALAYMARSDSWLIVHDADPDEAALHFKPRNAHDDATPWGFARAALAAADRPEGETPQEGNA